MVPFCLSFLSSPHHLVDAIEGENIILIHTHTTLTQDDLVRVFHQSRYDQLAHTLNSFLDTR